MSCEAQRATVLQSYKSIFGGVKIERILPIFYQGLNYKPLLTPNSLNGEGDGDGGDEREMETEREREGIGRRGRF